MAVARGFPIPHRPAGPSGIGNLQPLSTPDTAGRMGRFRYPESSGQPARLRCALTPARPRAPAPDSSRRCPGGSGQTGMTTGPCTRTRAVRVSGLIGSRRSSDFFATFARAESSDCRPEERRTQVFGASPAVVRERRSDKSASPSANSVGPRRQTRRRACGGCACVHLLEAFCRHRPVRARVALLSRRNPRPAGSGDEARGRCRRPGADRCSLLLLECAGGRLGRGGIGQSASAGAPAEGGKEVVGVSIYPYSAKGSIRR